MRPPRAPRLSAYQPLSCHLLCNSSAFQLLLLVGKYFKKKRRQRQNDGLTSKLSPPLCLLKPSPCCFHNLDLQLWSFQVRRTSNNSDLLCSFLAVAQNLDVPWVKKWFRIWGTLNAWTHVSFVVGYRDLHILWHSSHGEMRSALEAGQVLWLLWPTDYGWSDVLPCSRRRP